VLFTNNHWLIGLSSVMMQIQHSIDFQFFKWVKIWHITGKNFKMEDKSLSSLLPNHSNVSHLWHKLTFWTCHFCAAVEGVLLSFKGSLYKSMLSIHSVPVHINTHICLCKQWHQTWSNLLSNVKSFPFVSHWSVDHQSTK
jgi:hypothetical protein